MAPSDGAIMAINKNQWGNRMIFGNAIKRRKHADGVRM